MHNYWQLSSLLDLHSCGDVERSFGLQLHRHASAQSYMEGWVSNFVVMGQWEDTLQTVTDIDQDFLKCLSEKWLLKV